MFFLERPSREGWDLAPAQRWQRIGRILPGPNRQSEVSDDGRWSGFLEIDSETGYTNLRVFEVAIGRVCPLVIALPRTDPVVCGRMRRVDVDPGLYGPPAHAAQRHGEVLELAPARAPPGGAGRRLHCL